MQIRKTQVRNFRIICLYSICTLIAEGFLFLSIDIFLFLFLVSLQLTIWNRCGRQDWLVLWKCLVSEQTNYFTKKIFGTLLARKLNSLKCYMFLYKYINIYIYIYMCACVCECVCVCVYVSVCEYVNMYICVCVYIYAYVYIYIYIYTHIYIIQSS